MTEIIRRLAYEIWQRTDWDKNTNWFMAERMINRVLDDYEDVSSLSYYLSVEDIDALTKIKAEKNKADSLKD